MAKTGTTNEPITHQREKHQQNPQRASYKDLTAIPQTVKVIKNEEREAKCHNQREPQRQDSHMWYSPLPDTGMHKDIW